MLLRLATSHSRVWASLMADTLEELERRVLALEKGQHELQRAQNENTVSLKWLAGTLAQIEALAYDHRERLKGIEGRLGAIEITGNAQAERLDRIENGVKGLRKDMPGILADALRDRRRTDQPPTRTGSRASIWGDASSALLRLEKRLQITLQLHTAMLGFAHGSDTRRT